MKKLPGLTLWEEIRAARSNGLTRQGSRYFQLDVFRKQPIAYSIPARIYEGDFQHCFLWVLGGIVPASQPAPERDAAWYQKNYGKPLPLYHIIPYLNILLGEKLELVYGFSVLVDDYQYLADLIKEGTAELLEVPASLTHAHDWLAKQIERLDAINLETGIADASRKMIEQHSLSNAKSKAFTSPSPFKWKGTSVEIVELGYALIASELIDVTGQREHFIHSLAMFFGTSLKKPANVISKAKGRGSKKTTVLDKLKAALEQFLITSKSDIYH
jgi:hypothetical protein